MTWVAQTVLRQVGAIALVAGSLLTVTASTANASTVTASTANASTANASTANASTANASTARAAAFGIPTSTTTTLPGGVTLPSGVTVPSGVTDSPGVTVPPGVTGPPGSTGAGPLPPGTVVVPSVPPVASGGAAAPIPASELVTIAAEQIQVVTRDYGIAVARAAVELGADQTALIVADGLLGSDTAAAGINAKAVATDVTTVATDTAALTSAVVARRRATAVLDLDRLRLRAVAVALYVGPPNGVGVSPVANLAAAQTAGDAETSLSIAEQTMGSHVRADASRVVVTRSRQEQLETVVARDTAASTSDIGRDKAAEASVTADAGRVAAGRLAVAAALATSGAAQQAQSAAVEAVSTPHSSASATTPPVSAATPPASAATPPAGGPSVLGPAALSATELIDWFVHHGGHARTRATLAELAGWYLADGAVEGVRGDLAFAQAVLETGGFSSPDSVTINNYAGIGHCDTCATGLRFASPETGVIGQLQLLRILADATSVTGLPQALASATLAPAKQSRRGCCGTWTSLTGVWATDPNYGGKILALYAAMLASALSEPPVLPVLPVPPAPPRAAGS